MWEGRDKKKRFVVRKSQTETVDTFAIVLHIKAQFQWRWALKDSQLSKIVVISDCKASHVFFLLIITFYAFWKQNKEFIHYCVNNHYTFIEHV